VGVNSFSRTLFANSLRVVGVEDGGSDVRSKKNMRSRCISLIAAKLLTTWLSMVVVLLPSLARSCVARALSAVAWVVESKNALDTERVYSTSLIVYFDVANLRRRWGS